MRSLFSLQPTLKRKLSVEAAVGLENSDEPTNPVDSDEGGSDGSGNDGNIRKDLSDWQEKHAMLVLSKVKELSQLRFKLCPRYLKERDFWRIYFTLTRSYVIEYELHAIRLEKLKELRAENGTVSNTSACELEIWRSKLKSRKR
ncbi:BSD domain containing [Olea europaea subsp. europaea]|uniref:BSD domain containing n=1 Tax=Olea europaea subsp. europaea TaxID=158383 RepID=A0A8S0Q1D9_OLEEU|nr:BSD domain containing [Olea europaea subsp. europaea]